MPRIANMPLLLIAALYCGISILLFNEYGVKVVKDSHRYLEYADNLKNGFYFDKHNFWYVGYVLFIFTVHLFFDSIEAIVIAQYLLSFIAVIAVYKASLLVFKDTTSAVISSVSYILFVDIPTWNSYILCESFYCSLTCISLCLLAFTYNRSYHFSFYIIVAMVVGITAFAKPTGIALTISVLTIPLLRLWGKYKSIGIRTLSVFIFSTTFILLINKMLTTYHMIENYQIGEIIYEISTLPYNEAYELMIIDPPDNMYVPSQNNPPLLRIVTFIIHHPFYFMRLFAGKVFYLIFHVRPYWSWAHNLFSLLFLLPFYFYTIRVFKRDTLNKEIKIFSSIYILIHCISVGLTSEDWDGRFLMPLLPVVFLLGASEISVHYKKLVNQLEKRKSEG